MKFFICIQKGKTVVKTKEKREGERYVL